MAAADPLSQQRKLQILCLHGSRQDGEVFAQRLKTLQKKLKSIADLHFVSAPHTLPLQEGQTVSMRAWWRHWHVSTAEELQNPEPQQQHEQLQTQSSLQPQSSLQSAASFTHGKEREQEVHCMMAAGWEAVVLRDWAVSLHHLCDVWQAGPPKILAQRTDSASSSSSSISSMSSNQQNSSVRNNSANNSSAGSSVALPNGSAAAAAAAMADPSGLEYDGVLGFSNGAAAAFLFAAHAAAHPERFRSLRFVTLAGGYVPEPLDKLLPAQLLRQPPLNPSSSSSSSNGAQGSSSSSSDVPPVDRLAAQLPFASLHMMGSNDPLMDVADSSQLMECFQEHGRVQLIHDSGHSVPQQSKYMQEILKFIAQFAELPLPSAQHKQHRPHRAAAAAAAGGGAGLQRAPSLRAAARLPAAAAAVPPGGVKASAAAIEGKLHRQGLRDKAIKGPHKHHTLIKVDPSGVPHQHVDLLSPRKQHTPQQQQQQRFKVMPQQPLVQQQQQENAQQLHAEPQNFAPPPPPAAAAAAQDAITFGAASDIQREELEALEAIFSNAFHLISDAPPTFTIKLRDPDSLGDEEQQQEDAAAAAGLPSRLFTLKFKLPQEYPGSATSLPVIDIDGPLGAHDPARLALHNHMATAAAEQQQEMGGEGGYIWQIANIAKEWIDANLPADISNRKAGQDVFAQGGTVQAVHSSIIQGLASSMEGLGITNSSSSSNDKEAPWWEKEEIHIDLIDKATAEAAEAHWKAWAVADEASPFGSTAEDLDLAAAAAAVGSGSGSSSSSSSSSGTGFGGLDSARGRWDYTVGLVGKPSAGKSTFYNAVVDPERQEDAAREAPFPFTTITPNIGRGHIVLPDPAPLLGFAPQQAQPAYGYTLGFDLAQISPKFSNIGPLLQLVKDCGWQQQQQQSGDGSSGMLWRRVPVVVKDVAGLVPGAYKGRGRGNAFLNDLCDADVLVHVVDVSGQTDSEGAGAAPGEGADPRQDVLWVRRELHCWVYANVAAKWPTVLRRPNRLPGLFTGYHAPAALVHAVLRAVGVKIEDLNAEAAAIGNAGLQGGTKEASSSSINSSNSSSSLASWGEWELHRLVAHFLAARFPILLALNKADLPTAAEHIRAVLQAYPHDAAVAVSAASERQLQQLRRAGQIHYLEGSGNLQVTSGGGGSSSGGGSAAAAAVEAVQRDVLQQYGSTGVLAALTCAVALKPPRWVFPIADRERCTALAAITSRAAAGGGGSSSSSKASSAAGALGWGVDAKARAAQGAATGVLRDCLLLKPGSRVEDVYQVLKRPPYGLLDGEFVRAECRVLTSAGAAADSKGKGHGVKAGVVYDHEQQQQQQQQQEHKDGSEAAAAAAAHRVQCRVVRKDELLGPSNCVLLLQTNRKVSWQGSAAAK